MIVYINHFDSNKTMSFKVIDNRLLRKYTKIWERVSILVKIEFASKPVCSDNDDYLKTKIKSYGDKVSTNLPGKKITKENSTCNFLSFIMTVIRVS